MYSPSRPCQEIYTAAYCRYSCGAKSLSAAPLIFYKTAPEYLHPLHIPGCDSRIPSRVSSTASEYPAPNPVSLPQAAPQGHPRKKDRFPH